MVTLPSGPPASRVAASRRLHPAWLVAAVAFVALIGAAGFRAAPGVLMVPLTEEFGWSRGIVSAAVAINLVLFGLTAPFAAALMDRFGVRRVTTAALVLIAAGSAAAIAVEKSWQLMLTWGLLIGLGTGSMALVFAATIANRWFVEKRGLVLGVLTAGSATGQLIFLPVIAWVAQQGGWRSASLVIASGALCVIPFVWFLLRDRPEDIGVRPYGASPDYEPPVAAPDGPGPAARAVQALTLAARTRTFWALAIGFAICGATTNGLVGTHFIPSAHDHGMQETTAAGLLAVVGIFDIAGTIASGVLTDRINPRYLLGAYYTLRGVGLLVLPILLSDVVHPSIVLFVVIYGLDWVATVPPTAVLCRQLFGEQGTIVFGWVFASHQIGAAIASFAAGVVRDQTGTYTLAWVGGSILCLVAAFLSMTVRRTAVKIPLPTAGSSVVDLPA